MSYKEKIPKLVDVYRPSIPLEKRQLPLVVDENLTLVMDVKNSGIICDNQHLRGKDLEEFGRKWGYLSQKQLQQALQITKSELLHVLNQNVPCVGCRRSVDRLYYQLLKFGHPTLDPLIVTSDGTISIREEKQTYQIIGSIFNGHALRLAKLIENQPKKNKNSVRCLLHSLDSQRNRPLTPVWKDVWDCMKQDCKKDVCIIEASSLHATLETYLRKHRFCAECRTKVLKAYMLLVEDPEPAKEKGYVSSLYAGIKRCLPDKHIHLQPKTETITKLISRAEPELLGSRRERHAKTLEIAQEEVLTCLGICMYERLHRIYMRMREEECTCQVFAAVAVHTLSRSFETAVENHLGVSRLELLYAEFEKEEQRKQILKEQKKIKRKRKKGKIVDQEVKEDNCSDCNVHNESKTELEEESKECSCPSSSETCNKNDLNLNCYSCEQIHHSPERKTPHCQDDRNCTNEVWIDDCKCDETDEPKRTLMICKCCSGSNTYFGDYNKKESGSNSDHSHDCGYSSENNNGSCESGSLVSSLSSSPEGSEVACSDNCCHQDNDYIPYCRLAYGGGNGHHLSLQEMLEVHSEDDCDEDCYITPEEVKEFKSKNRLVYEKRRQLRETLQTRFAQFCVNGPAPQFQTKYAD